MLLFKATIAALKNVYSIGGLCTVVSTNFLAVERSVASVLYKTYEKLGRRWLGVGLTLIQVVGAALSLLSHCRCNVVQHLQRFYRF